MTDRFYQKVADLVQSGADTKTMQVELDKDFGETCAMLVLDSTGFSRMTNSQGSAYFISILYRLRTVCREIFKNHDMIDMRPFADNVFAEFPTVDQALQAALSVHKYFQQHPLFLSEKQDQFGVCAGIGFGEVLRTDFEGVYGDEMNRASKLGEDIAKCGETLLSHAAWNAVINCDSISMTEGKTHISGIDIAYYSVCPKVEDV
jgi:adenylate cyclase